MDSNSFQTELFPKGPPGPRTYTWSMIETGKRCPLEFRVKYIDRNLKFFPGGRRVLLSRVLHSCMNHYFSLAPEARSVEKMIGIKTRILSREANKFDSDSQTALLQMLLTFLKFDESRFTTIMTEKKLEAEFMNTRFETKLDILGESGGQYTLLDFKLGRTEQLYGNGAVEDYLQLWFTCFLMPEMIRQKVSRIGFYFFADGALDVVKFQEDLYEQATERVLAIVSDLEMRDDFPPVINPLCSSCGYVSLCPAFKKDEGATT